VCPLVIKIFVLPQEPVPRLLERKEGHVHYLRDRDLPQSSQVVAEVVAAAVWDSPTAGPVVAMGPLVVTSLDIVEVMAPAVVVVSIFGIGVPSSHSASIDGS
jgi:hypothetical protein